MDATDVEIEVEGDVAIVFLNRPEKLNAATSATTAQLVEAIERVDRDDSVRAIVVTGRGRAFCAGADLSGGQDVFDYEKKREALAARYVDGVDAPRDGAGLISLAIYECRKPVLAAINGPAIGMGLTFTLAADIRLASDTAKFGFVFTQRGIVPEGASTWFLPRLVGMSQAAEWLYTARIFGPDEALAGGLVRSVHPVDEVLPATLELAHEMAAAAPVSVGLTRQMLWRMQGYGHPMFAHRADSRAVHATGAMPDAREGINAFLEKRPASFVGRVSTDLPDIFPGWVPPEYA